MNIRNSMYRLFIVLVVVPFSAFSLLLAFIYSAKLNAVIQESLGAVANSQLAEMSDFCRQQKNNLNTLGRMDISRAALHGELDQDTLLYFNDMLDAHVQAISYLDNIALLDTDYRIAACSMEDHPVYAASEFGILIEQMAEKPFYISNTLSYPYNGSEVQSVIAISSITDNGNLLGYALSEINLDFYDNIRKQTKLWNESTFYLLDGNQKIISAGTQADKRNSFVTTDAERKDYRKKYNAVDFEAQPQGSFSYRVGGGRYITYYSAVEYTDWRVLLSVNLDRFLNRGEISILFMVSLVVLCAALTLFLGRFASKRIVRPIRRISDTLHVIQQNQDYSLRVEAVKKDELGTLSEEINGLVSVIETENLYRAKQERLLREMAEKDALTQVMNTEKIRRYLRTAIERHQSDKTPMAVLFVDIDNFKAFNTNYGHSVGDQVLLFVASLLTEETDGVVGRVGGDEFVTVVEKAEILKHLDTCLEWVNSPSHSRFLLRDNGESLPVCCSIGAVTVDFNVSCPDEITAEQLMDMADAAMYEAKDNGKCGYVIRRYPSCID